MPITSNLNQISVAGELTADDCFRLIAAMHNTVDSKGFRDFSLDFTGCTKAFADQMLPICARCQQYWSLGVDVSLLPPRDERMSRLFVNTNWAHLIDVRSFEPSRFRGYTHAPVIKFTNGQEQHLAVTKILDILLAAISHFERDDIRYIEWAVNEVTDNVINHAHSDVGGFVQITNFRQRQQIQFSVCDPGIGIPTSLRNTHSEIRSDTEALDKAIREGVTRDKSFGQGNGLYGTWRITQKSGGSLTILSGHAILESSERGGTHITTQGIPFNGSLVSARIGYSETLDLSDALVFSGKKHVPIDYITTHFDSDDDGNVIFSLSEESDGFGTRTAGEPVRRKLRNVIRCLEGGRAIVDFQSIPLVSSSYADEVFGKLFLDLGPIEFSKSIEFKNLDPLVKDLIDRAIIQRMNE